MGEIYRARDPRLGRDVAIKVLPPSFAADADRLRRFEQEARAVAALNHPNILTVHEIGAADGPYIVSELLDGRTLRATLANGGLSIKKVIDYALQIANGMAAAHDKGIVHRDLKPENVFVTSDGRVKILDFGLAKLTEPAVARVGGSTLPTRAVETSPGSVMGTVGYMSPEQVRGLAVDQRSDIFSFGVVLYEMVRASAPSKVTRPRTPSARFSTRNHPNYLTAQRGFRRRSTVSFAIVSRSLRRADSSRRAISLSHWREQVPTNLGSWQIVSVPSQRTDGA